MLPITLQELTPHSHFPKALGMQRTEASSVPSPGSMEVHSGPCQMALKEEGLAWSQPQAGCVHLRKSREFSCRMACLL